MGLTGANKASLPNIAWGRDLYRSKYNNVENPERKGRQDEVNRLPAHTPLGRFTLAKPLSASRVAGVSTHP
jgi:hypothetical protein